MDSDHFPDGTNSQTFSVTDRSNTHTRLTTLRLGLPRWAGTRKVKPIWILLKQETVSGSDISWAMQVCTSLQTDNHASTHHSVFTARCYESAVLAVGLCLHKSRVLLKRLNVGSHKQHHTIPQGCQRSPRNSTRVTPYWGAKCSWGGSQLATFDK